MKAVALTALFLLTISTTGKLLLHPEPTTLCTFIVSKLTHIFSFNNNKLVLSCKVSSVDPQTYTTTDGLVVTNVAHIVTFTLTCSSGRSDQLTLFAEIPAIKQTVLVSLAPNGKSYQVSWTEEAAKATTGEKEIKIYDEEGLAALRKAQRKAEETGTSPSPVEPLTKLTVYHPGLYKGPLFQVQVLAVSALILVYYVAYNAKSKLVA